MSDAAPRVLALPPSVVAGRPAATLRDLERYASPDAVWVLGPDREPKAFARARQCFEAPAFHPPLATGEGPVRRREIGPDALGILAVQSASALEARAAEIRALLDGDSGTATADPACDDADGTIAALACDDVTTTVRPTALETTLDRAGVLATTLPSGHTTTVLSGSLPADYDERWSLEPGSGRVLEVDHDPAVTAAGSPAEGADSVGIRLRGVGPVEGYGGARTASLLALSGSGVETVETLPVDGFGLEAVSGIGPKTARRLAERDVRTRVDLLETSVSDLAALPGVGRTRAEKMLAHARVLESGEPVRPTDESLPGEDWPRPPLCLDIETDGLSPTIVWQVGVYDPETDEYRAFVERDDPADPGPVLEAFCDWLLGIHPDRALLTWNGWRFDYRHLGAFLARHVPHYAEEWASIPKLDLYGWAVRDENALLPGRTNKLDDVASALGYDGAGTGLDGAATAAAYQRFMRTGAELEWDRHEAYCEDDCRALWHVYERLRDAPTADGAGRPTRRDAGAGSETEDRTERTTDSTDGEQTGLSDFGT